MAGLRETEQLVKLVNVLTAEVYTSTTIEGQLRCQMLDELNVRCTAEGCGKVMQRGLLLSHSRTCLKAIVTCPDDGCGLSVSSLLLMRLLESCYRADKQMAAHRLPHHRAYECFKRRMACGRCDVLLTFREAQVSSGKTMSRDECRADRGVS